MEAVIVDHVVELKDGGAELSPDNSMSLCRSCHNKKTAREKKRRGQWFMNIDKNHRAGGLCTRRVSDTHIAAIKKGFYPMDAIKRLWPMPKANMRLVSGAK